MGRGLAQQTIDLRDRCHAILEEIQPATVRAVCYRLFVEKLLPDMSKNSTAKVSRILTSAREDRFIHLEWIVDETLARTGVPVERSCGPGSHLVEVAAIGATCRCFVARHKDHKRILLSVVELRGP